MKSRGQLATVMILLVVSGLLVAFGASLNPRQPLPPDPSMTDTPTPVATVSVIPSSTPTAQVVFDTCEVDKMMIPDLPLKKNERNKWNIISMTAKQDAEGDIPLPPRDSSLNDPHPPAALVSGYTQQYHKAGPKADDMVLVIGHSSPWRVLPFNSLMNQGKDGEGAPRVKVGQHIYLHTTCSGEWWVDYEVGETLTAGKPAFTSDPRIFGTTKMPGRVAVVTCLQPKEGHSIKVVAIIGQYKGLVKFPG